MSCAKKNTLAVWTDLLDELVALGAFPGRVHRLLLYGPPATGKSSYVFHAVSAEGEPRWPHVERQVCDPDQCAMDWLDSVELVNGTTHHVDGPAVRAMRLGCPLVMDEIDRISPSCIPIAHAICDDLSIAQLRLPNGETLRPAPGYCVVATTNASPATLPGALLSRFGGGLIIHADVPCPAVIAQIAHDLCRAGMPAATSAGFAGIIGSSYGQTRQVDYTVTLATRSALGMAALAGVLGAERAAEIIFGHDVAIDLLASAAVAGGAT